jgi:hypothetical protein
MMTLIIAINNFTNFFFFKYILPFILLFFFISLKKNKKIVILQKHEPDSRIGVLLGNNNWKHKKNIG